MKVKTTVPIVTQCVYSRTKKMRTLFILFILPLLFCQAAFAEDFVCGYGSGNQPCAGASGFWTVNWDGSPGGFVADTAYVESRSLFGFFRRNIPYLGQCVQVCESARVEGEEVRIDDFAMIFGKGHVSGAAEIFEFAHVFGEAHVFGKSLVYGHSEVSGEVQLFGDVQILGSSRINGSEVFNQGYLEPAEWGHVEVPEAQALLASEAIAPTSFPIAFHLEENEISIHSRGRITSEMEKSARARLRQLSADKTLVESCSSRVQVQKNIQALNEKLNAARSQLEEIDSRFERCPVCFEPLFRKQEIYLSQCNHMICTDCLNRLSTHERHEKLCPMCRASEFDENSCNIHYLVNDFVNEGLDSAL